MITNVPALLDEPNAVPVLGAGRARAGPGDLVEGGRAAVLLRDERAIESRGNSQCGLDAFGAGGDPIVRP